MDMVTSSSAFTAALQVLDMTNFQDWTKVSSASSSSTYDEYGLYPAPPPKFMDDVETGPFLYHPHVLSAVPKVMTVNTTACDLVCAQALVMMSAAKKAIVQAQGGTSGNRGPYWGCDGLPLYQADSFSHIWTDCPHKAVLEVCQNAQKNLSSDNDRKLAASKSTSSDVHTVLCNPAEELKTKWDDEGHPSYEKAALLVSIVDPTTEKKVCQVCFQALTKGTKRNALEVEYASAKMPPGSSTGTNHPVIFVGIPVIPAALTVSSFQAGVVPASKSVFHLSQIMPHASISIGLQGTGNIIAMVDSGLGCNIGCLNYFHKSIANTQELEELMPKVPQLKFQPLSHIIHHRTIVMGKQFSYHWD
jgi:hypothetical protein